MYSGVYPCQTKRIVGRSSITGAGNNTNLTTIPTLFLDCTLYSVVVLALYTRWLSHTPITGKDTRIRPIQTAFQLFNPLSLVAADYPTSLPAFLCLSLSISFSSSFSLFSLLSDWDGFLLYLLTTRSWYYRHTHLHSHSLYHHHHHHHYTTFLSLSLSLSLSPPFTSTFYCIYSLYLYSLYYTVPRFSHPALREPRMEVR